MGTLFQTTIPNTPHHSDNFAW